MDCGKCRDSQMVAATAPRVSARVRVVGYVMSFAGLVIVLFGSGGAMLPAGTPGGIGADARVEAREETAAQLRQLDGMLESFVADFEADGAVSDVALTQLPDNDRVLAESILGQYEETSETFRDAEHLTTGLRGDTVVASWMVGLPLVGVGGFLTLNKKVWECRSCGFVTNLGGDR